jgi:hypothetical protein
VGGKIRSAQKIFNGNPVLPKGGIGLPGLKQDEFYREENLLIFGGGMN